MQRAWFARRDSIDFNTAETTFFERDVQGGTVLAVEKKDSGIAEKWLVAD